MAIRRALAQAFPCFLGKFTERKLARTFGSGRAPRMQEPSAQAADAMFDVLEAPGRALGPVHKKAVFTAGDAARGAGGADRAALG